MYDAEAVSEADGRSNVGHRVGRPVRIVVFALEIPQQKADM